MQFLNDLELNCKRFSHANHGVIFKYASFNHLAKNVPCTKTESVTSLFQGHKTDIKVTSNKYENFLV